MVDNNIGFKQIMFVISLEDYTDQEKLKVAIPDIFLNDASEVKSITCRKGRYSLYRNSTPPALSSHYTIDNYIELPFTLSMSLNLQSNNSSSILKGDKLLAVFPNENPKNAYIIGRC